MKIPLSEIQILISNAERDLEHFNKINATFLPNDIEDSYNNLIWHLKQIEKELK